MGPGQKRDLEMKHVQMAGESSIIRLIVLALLAGLLLADNADEPNNEPTVVVIGKKPDGRPLTCSTGSCFDTAQEETARAHQEYLAMYAVLPEEELPLDGERFCSTLKSKKPSGCNLNSPPSAPDYDQNWQPNGCGTAGRQWIIDFVLASSHTENYSGDPNAPYAGVSFLAACNAHDQCWGRALDRTFCDSRFGDNVRAQCDTVSSSSGWGTCQGFASAYHAAVSPNDLSNPQRASSVSKSQCAGWAHDMQANNCQQ